MVPIYDSDLAEDRWSKAEWSHYELWEKVDQRIRKHKRLWIAATVLVFILLSSIPVIIEQRPKWRSLSAARKLGQEINWMKSEAAIHHSAYRIRFEGTGSLRYEVETADHCGNRGNRAAMANGMGSVTGDPAAFKSVRSGSLLASGDESFVLLSREQGQRLNIPQLLESYCYDPLQGGQAEGSADDIAAFAIIPVNDLSVGRMDRLSVLLLSGASAELSFE
jgi:hypothetical protein